MDIVFLLLIQSFFDAFLLILVLILYRQVRRLKDLPLQQTLERLEEANRLCERLLKEIGARANSHSDKKATSVREEVLALAERGFSAEAIAEKLGLQEAEVNLLLSLKSERGKRWKS